MAEFYDHESGVLYFRAPAGGGNSVWDAPATPSDIAANPAAHREYVLGKRSQANAAEAAKVESEAIEALRAENAALHARIAEFAKAAEAPVIGETKSDQQEH